MYGYGYDYPTTTSALSVGGIIWVILASVLAVVGGILVYILFLNSKKEKKLNNKLQWLKNFLEFKIMIVETILKVCYLISTIFVILFSFTFIASSFLIFISCLIFGPIIIRLFYECSLMFIMIWKNTTEINKNTKK